MCMKENCMLQIGKLFTTLAHYFNWRKEYEIQYGMLNVKIKAILKSKLLTFWHTSEIIIIIITIILRAQECSMHFYSCNKKRNYIFHFSIGKEFWYECQSEWWELNFALCCRGWQFLKQKNQPKLELFYC